MRRFTSGKQKSVTTLDGTKINYEIDFVDKQKVLVFIHGLNGDLTAWDKERLFFKELGYTTIAFDLRGHGLSDRPGYEEAYSLKRMTTDIKDILDKEKIKKTILIGHCLGGIMAVIFGALFKSHAEALILVSATYKPVVSSEHPAAQHIINKVLSCLATHCPEKYIHGYRETSHDRYVSEHDVIGGVLNLLYTSFHDYLFIFEHFIDLDLKETLLALNVPTLIVAGQEDKLFPAHIAKEIHHKIKNSELEFIEGGNHMTVINNPIELSVTIQHFLQKNVL